jgi:hypothetical protein
MAGAAEHSKMRRARAGGGSCLRTCSPCSARTPRPESAGRDGTRPDCCAAVKHTIQVLGCKNNDTRTRLRRDAAVAHLVRTDSKSRPPRAHSPQIFALQPTESTSMQRCLNDEQSNLLSHDTPQTRHGEVMVTNFSMPTAGAAVSADGADWARRRESASEKRTDSAFGKIGAKMERMAGLQWECKYQRRSMQAGWVMA